MLLHEVGDTNDEGRVKRRVLLDVSIFVVDDGTVEAGGRERCKLEITNEATEKIR